MEEREGGHEKQLINSGIYYPWGTKRPCLACCVDMHGKRWEKGPEAVRERAKGPTVQGSASHGKGSDLMDEKGRYYQVIKKVLK